MAARGALRKVSTRSCLAVSFVIHLRSQPQVKKIMSLTYFTNTPPPPQQITGQALLSGRAETETSNYFFALKASFTEKTERNRFSNRFFVDSPFILQSTIDLGTLF